MTLNSFIRLFLLHIFGPSHRLKVHFCEVSFVFCFYFKIVLLILYFNREPNFNYVTNKWWLIQKLHFHILIWLECYQNSIFRKKHSERSLPSQRLFEKESNLQTEKIRNCEPLSKRILNAQRTIYKHYFLKSLRVSLLTERVLFSQ